MVWRMRHRGKSEPSAFTIAIRRTAELDDREVATFAQWTRDIFGAEEDKYEWAEPDWHVVVRSEDRYVCHGAITERVATAGGASVKLGGIGNVMTPPTWRGRGLGAAAMREAAAFMRDTLRVEFGLLLCSAGLVPWYCTLDWRRVKAPLSFWQAGGKVRWDEEAMVLACTERVWPEGPIDLCGLPW